MEREDRIEELLETIWVAAEEHHKTTKAESLIDSEGGLLQDMVDQNLIVHENGLVQLTDKGARTGRDVVRRHRLAELLLTTVLDVKNDDLVHEAACRFEHLLHKGLDQKICTLLGHPKTCPHGKAIPAGPCCHKENGESETAVLPLSRLKPGQQLKVAYLRTTESKEVQKLMAMGVLPGVSLRLLRNFPCFVFGLGHSQFAVDEKMACEIFVRRIENE